MPRCARIKSFDAIYHVMCRSISEVDLFKSNDDKKKYLSLIKEYQKVYLFRIYSYCLMNNHVHLLLDANGADISTIMHCINFKYAQYFNRIHKRHGHLFQDRFKSKIVKDENYLYALSAYIHNNPTDISGYENRPENYFFSSLGIYLGLRKDPFELVEDRFVLNLFGSNPTAARAAYKSFMSKCNEIFTQEEVEFVNDKTEYRSERKILVRDMSPADVVDYIVEKMNINKMKIHTKHSREMVETKAILSVALRSLCNSKCSIICNILGNITQSRVSKYCSIGLKLIDSDERYRNILYELIGA